MNTDVVVNALFEDSLIWLLNRFHCLVNPGIDFFLCFLYIRSAHRQTVEKLRLRAFFLEVIDATAEAASLMGAERNDRLAA